MGVAPAPPKIDLLAQCRASTGRNARRWTALAARNKGVDETSLAGEEAITGPWAVLAALNAYLDTLGRIERYGWPGLDRPRVRSRADGQVVAEVFPSGVYDRILNPGLRAEVWMLPGITRQTVRDTMAAWFRLPSPPSRVSLVLGAGNLTSIGLLDVLYKLLAEGSTVMLKLHPLLQEFGPIFEDSFAPLVAGGYLRFAFGGSGVGGYLCRHRAIDDIHVTGSQSTFDALTQANTACKPITSELGNVSPAIVVPGQWSRRDLRFHAEPIATAKLHNAGYNCIALQVLVVPAQWNRTAPLVAAVRRVFERARDRPAYYPGTAQRYETLVAGRASLTSCGRGGAGFVARTIVEVEADDRGDALFRTEAFCGLLAVVTIAGSTLETYLQAAVAFCNDRLLGNLAATLIVDRETRRRHCSAVDDAIAGMNYGCVGVNVWGGVGFMLPAVPWGSYAGDTRARNGSGSGVVHNSRLFSSSQKSVLYAPFAPLGGRLKPPWFLTHRNQAEIGLTLCEFEISKSPLALAKIAWLTLTG